MWRHYQVLAVIHDAAKEKLDIINEGKLQLREKGSFIWFCKAGMQQSSKPLPETKKFVWRGKWNVTSDIEDSLIFPIVQTSDWLDLLVWQKEKIRKFIELTVSWELT